MKRSLLAIPFAALALTIAACAPESARMPAAAPLASPAQASPAQERGAFFALAGKIGEYPARLNLMRRTRQDGGEVAEGVYYYERVTQPIDVFGSLRGDSLLLDVSIDPNAPESFRGVFDAAGAYSGTWSKGEKSLSFSFQAQPSAPLTFQLALRADSLKGRTLGGDSARAYIAQWWLTPQAADPELADFVRREAESLMDGDQEHFAALRDSFFRDFRTYVLEDSFPSEMIEYLDESRLEVIYLSPGLLTLRKQNYSYSGGAHGNYYATLSAYDLNKRSRIRYADLLKPGFETPLKAALEKRIRVHFAIPAGEPLSSMLLVDSIELPEHFGVTDKGLFFFFSPYEIAAYAYGPSEFFIPFAELKGFVRADNPSIQP